VEKASPIDALSPAVPMEEMGQLLANLLKQHGSNSTVAPNSRPASNLRKALVCTAQFHREAIARQLTKNGYQVFVARDTAQAVDRMRENQIEVVY